MQSRDHWVLSKCQAADVKHCEKCDQDFKDFELIRPKSSVAGTSNTLCEIKKQKSEMNVDDGEYVCQLLKCATPENGGCNMTPDQFQKYDILPTASKNSVNVQVYLNCGLT